MIHEKSCGAIVFTEKDGKRYYLVEQMLRGHHSFCKGHMEGDETEHQTAAREIMEETGLSVEFVDGFRECIEYSPYKGCVKTVVFFLAAAKGTDVIAQKEEVKEIIWLEFENAMTTLTFDSEKETLQKAEAFLQNIKRTHETDRLILRRWEDSDAEDLYKYASDPDVGPIAGWPPHQSVDESRDVIKNVFSGKEAYAICLKEDGKAIGAIELKLNGHTDMTDRDDECELGYWLGKPFWGQGIMPEAVKEMLRHAFEDCGMQKVWIGYYEGNEKSKRVQEKCGFKYQWRSENVDVPLLHEKRTGHVSLMTKEDWKVILMMDNS